MKGLVVEGLSLNEEKTNLFSNRSTLSWLATVGSRRYPPAKIEGVKRVNYSDIFYLALRSFQKHFYILHLLYLSFYNEL